MSEEYPERDAQLPFVDLRGDHRGILVFAEMNGAQLANSALELIGEANRQKVKLDADSQMIYVVVIGKSAQEEAKQLIKYGADTVYTIAHEKLGEYLNKPFTRALISVINKVKPEIALFSASTLGRDLAPRIAAIMNCGLSADCTEFDIGYYANRKRKQRFKKVFKMIRPSFGESKLATIIGPWNYPQMATARPGTFKPIDPDDSRTGNIINYTPKWQDDDFDVEVLEVVRSTETTELTKAKVIVAGGVGVGREGFSVLRELVDAIHQNGQEVELGASRGAVDAGYIDSKFQIGQTGSTVRPVVYIAIGISGAVQHLAGMKDSKKIIAINTDPNANIFLNADFGIVADYQEVVPELIKKVKSGYTFVLD